MATVVPERLYRNAAGDLVAEDAADAALLAFTAGTEMSDEEAHRTGVKAFLDARNAPAVAEHVDDESEKQARQVPNKMADRPPDKAAPSESKQPGPRSASKPGGR